MIPTVPHNPDDHKPGDHKPNGHNHPSQRICRDTVPKNLRLSGNYFERAKLKYTGKDKVTLSDTNEIFELHERLGHRSLFVLKKIYRIKLPSKYTSFECNACDAAKMTRKNASKVYSAGGRTGRVLPEGVDEWHLDLAFMPTRLGNRKGHIISTRVAVRSRSVDSEVISSKTEMLGSLKSMIARYKRETGRMPSRIQVDRGWEYLDTRVKEFCRDSLIDLHPTGSNQHGQMGIAERYNRTLKEHVFATLLARNTPLMFWPEAVEHEVVVYNRTPHSAINYRIPLEEDLKHEVDTWNIRDVFGCETTKSTESYG